MKRILILSAMVLVFTSIAFARESPDFYQPSALPAITVVDQIASAEQAFDLEGLAIVASVDLESIVGARVMREPGEVTVKEKKQQKEAIAREREPKEEKNIRDTITAGVAVVGTGLTVVGRAIPSPWGPLCQIAGAAMAITATQKGCSDRIRDRD